MYGMKFPAWILFAIFFFAGMTGSLMSKIDPKTTWYDVLTPFIAISGLSGGLVTVIALVTKSPGKPADEPGTTTESESTTTLTSTSTTTSDPEVPKK